MLSSANRREPLLRALADVDRLVLLGDVIELRHGPVRDALRAARPVLGAIGEALGAGREVVIVPGNHDHHLLTAWLDRQRHDGPPPALGLEHAIDWHAGETLAAVARALGPAEVRVSYPGIWLREGIYAMHGHYLDCHTTVPMFERLGAGAMARLVGHGGDGPRSSEDYEAILTPLYAWLHALAQNGGPPLGRSSHGASARAWRLLEGERSGGGGLRRQLGRGALTVGFPVVVAALNRGGIGPLRTDITAPELRRAALRALGEVVERLRIGAEQIVFGHTHRAGPLPDDDLGEWQAPTGANLINTGSWVHEPGFLGPVPGNSPYRAGFSVVVEGEDPARLHNLLD